MDGNKKTKNIIEVTESVKKQKNYTNDGSTRLNVRFPACPALDRKSAERMLNKEGGFHFHVGRVGSDKVLNIPYCLAFDKMYLTCHCSEVFKLRSGENAWNHMKKCDGLNEVENGIPKIQLNSAQYHEVGQKPDFFVYDGNLHLRMHPNMSTVACVCGFKRAISSMSEHMKKCRTYQSCLKLERAPKFRNILSSSLSTNPVIRVYKSKEKSVEDTSIEDMLMDRKNKLVKKHDIYNVYEPYEDGAVKFYLPIETKHHDINYSMFQLQMAIGTNNWKNIIHTIDHIPDDVENHEWGGTMIQSERYEIHLTFDIDQNAQERFFLCWKTICRTLNFDNKNMNNILQFAMQKTKENLGEIKYNSGTIATPALILCNTKIEQTFHLDIMGSNTKQFGMMLSNGETSTTIFKPVSETKIAHMSSTTQLLLDGINSLCKELAPSENLISIIHGLSDDSSIGKSIKEGYGELFRICRKYQTINNDKFDWTALNIIDAPMGTYYSVNGGIIHAGAGSTNGDVRVMLFWTWHGSGDEEYDKDKQETKLSLIVTLAMEVWPSLDKYLLKKEMIQLVYYCFMTCEDGYKKTAKNTFHNYPNVVKLIDAFFRHDKKCKRDNHDKLNKIFDAYAKNESLWDVK